MQWGASRSSQSPCRSDISSSTTGDSGGASVTPVDCFLNSSRVLTIATAFGIAIFALVYVSAAFSGTPCWGLAQVEQQTAK